MLYEVESRFDFSGATLVVRFSESDLDRKALNTIQVEGPSFLLPFNIRTIDEMVECTYEIGSNIKLIYQSGQKTQEECVAFWEMILQPLIDCDDWFMDPFCFALRPDMMYLAKSGKEVKYVYVPSLRQNASPEDLLGMVKELSKANPVSDITLENQILRAIMEDFKPVSFLRMLREQSGVMKAGSPLDSVMKAPFKPTEPIQQPVSQPMPSVPKQDWMAAKTPVVDTQPEKASVSKPQPKKPDYGDQDIIINLGSGSGSKGRKEKPAKQPKEKPMKQPKEKPVKAEKEKKTGGLFGSKKTKSSQSERMLYVGPSSGQYEPEHKKEPVRREPDYKTQAVSWASDSEEDAVTQLEEQNDGTGLQLIGDRSLPPRIMVNIQNGAAFTIGRFDINLGKKQNDFEFSKDKKFVSRHHAVIERSSDGRYYLIDLSSMGGTFLNDRRLQPNVPELLGNGYRVSFGNEGADYVWRE